MCVEHWRNDADKEKQKYSEKTPYQCHIFSHIYHMHCNGVELGHSCDRPAAKCLIRSRMRWDASRTVTRTATLASATAENRIGVVARPFSSVNTTSPSTWTNSSVTFILMYLAGTRFNSWATSLRFTLRCVASYTVFPPSIRLQTEQNALFLNKSR